MLKISALLKVANHQADPCITKCVLTGEAHMVVSGDSDFLMCLGINASFGDLMATDLLVDKKDFSIKTGKVVTGQRSAASHVESTLTTHMEGKFVFLARSKLVTARKIDTTKLKKPQLKLAIILQSFHA